MTPSVEKPTGLFRLEDGRNVVVTFALVSSLFLLWGFCNGMIDTMDKHFQDQLHLTKAQSAWVQFAHYMGYALMALPAGLLTRRIGYKGGIITGLAMVAVGGFWFIPATSISQFWAFLLGVCFIAMGLTVLETVANPYTTVLGPKASASTRINFAQAFNGVGWMLGPMVGGMFFYSDHGAAVAHGQLWIPYAGVGAVVLLLCVVFYFAPMPDFSFTDYDLGGGEETGTGKALHRPAVIFGFLLLNVAALGLSAYLVLHAILPYCGVGPDGLRYVTYGVVAAVVLSAPSLLVAARRVRGSSIWAHPHFTGATLAQFFYVAAQAGIFSFFINYIVEQMPAVSAGLAQLWPISGNAREVDGVLRVTERGASALQGLVAFGLFTAGRFVGAALLNRFPAHKLLGLYSVINVALCGVVMAKLGWWSTAAVFGSFFFMSIGFPTIFALGIHGLGSQSKKKASAFIVMAITGGALMPKVMGYLGDVYDMSVAFLMPLGCFVVIASYAFSWAKLSRSDGAVAVGAGKGH